MTQYGTWVSYGGAARIWLAAGLLAVALVVAGAGLRLPRPVRLTRPGTVVTTIMLVSWFVAIVVFLGCSALYIKQYLHEYPAVAAHYRPANHITPVTFVAAAVLFIAVLAHDSPSFGTRLAGAAIGAMAFPMIFELPFDLIVMARVYPPIPPDPAGYRAQFFVPLFAVEITTLLLLRLSPLVRITRYTFVSVALMLGVFAVWALTGFGYPSGPAPTTLNIVSKLLAFVAALTLFFPRQRAPEPAVPEPAQATR